MLRPPRGRRRGSLAGTLKSSGEFVTPGADSEVAIQCIHAATGTEADAGIVLLVDRPTPARLDAVAERLERHTRVARTEAGGRGGEQGIVRGTLRTRADEEEAAG